MDKQRRMVKTIDLVELFFELLSHMKIMVLVTILGAMIGYLYTSWMVVPIYQATTQIYVLNNERDYETVTYNDLMTASQLTNDYRELIKTAPVMEAVIAELNLEGMTWNGLASKVTVKNAVDNGRIISISVTDTSPIRAKLIADSICDNAAARLIDVMNVSAVNIVAKSKVPTSPISPSMKRNVAKFGMFFLMFVAGIFVLIFILDDQVKSTDDVEKLYGLSVLGTIPLDENKKTGRAKKKHR